MYYYALWWLFLLDTHAMPRTCARKTDLHALLKSTLASKVQVRWDLNCSKNYKMKKQIT